MPALKGQIWRGLQNLWPEEESLREDGNPWLILGLHQSKKELEGPAHHTDQMMTMMMMMVVVIVQ